MPKHPSQTAKLVAAIIASGALAAGTAEALIDAASTTCPQRPEPAARAGAATTAFSESARITNAWLPLSAHREAVMAGDQHGETLVSVHTLLATPGSVSVGESDLAAAVIEERTYCDGALRSTVRGRFVQAADGTVYRIAVDRDRSGRMLRVAMPAAPRDGQRFDSVPGPEIRESVRVIDTNARLTVPIGSFNRVLVLYARPVGGAAELRYYARGTGLIKQQNASGTIELVRLS